MLGGELGFCALFVEASAGFFPLALRAPEVPLVHAVDFAALLVVGPRPAARASRRPAHRRETHVLLETECDFDEVSYMYITTQGNKSHVL